MRWADKDYFCCPPMPLPYIVLHLLLCALCLLATCSVPPRSWRAPVLSIGMLLLVGGGFLLERRTDWAWSAMLLPWSGTVFMANLSLEGVTVLLAALWRQSRDRAARWRAALLSVPALAAALWSYGWYFLPAPPGLRGQVDRRGYCAQTSDDSCSAAAAVILLHHHGIRASEAEMARLCLTRQGRGTPPLGLYRGLVMKARPHGMRPRLQQFSTGQWQRMSALPGPAIISVGLAAGAPPRVAKQMEEYGWTPGLRHAVVVLKADPAGKWLEMADPSYGRERWGTNGLEHLWDGRALILARK